MISYTSIHWGTSPLYNDKASCASGLAISVGLLAACSYATVKGGKAENYRHKFESDTHLLQLQKDGDFMLKVCPSSVIAIGRALDFELVGGERVIIGGASWFVTNETGSHVWLVGSNIPYGIEYSRSGLFVTNHGIEG